MKKRKKHTLDRGSVNLNTQRAFIPTGASGTLHYWLPYRRLKFKSRASGCDAYSEGHKTVLMLLDHHNI